TRMKPKRSIHLCFGHDEEIGGYEGAAKAADYLAEQQISYAMVLDEGGAVTKGMLSAVPKPIAAFGTAEKGYMDIELTCRSSGGHSSMPEKQTALSRTAVAVARIHKHPFPARLTPPVKNLFRAVGPHMPFFHRLILSNLWLFKPLFFTLMGKLPSINALIRTTAVPTMAFGSDASNVLPEKAGFMVNIRMLPGDTSEQIYKQLVQIIADDHIELSIHRADEPSKISPFEGQAVNWLSDSIAQIFPDVVISPYLMAGSTDARKYELVSDAVYRFSPVELDPIELSGMHGSNERISLENIRRSVDFYLCLLQKVQV
nr:M20/M25/M40 family metallo-hydrolase [Spirochaetales bacterium]